VNKRKILAVVLSFAYLPAEVDAASHDLIAICPAPANSALRLGSNLSFAGSNGFEDLCPACEIQIHAM
jgi:hypothetical protein